MNDFSSIQKAGALLGQVTSSRHALEAARRLYEDRLAPDFSPLQFLWLDELMWSRLLGWLLNPRETHAQKGRFLHLFMRHVCQGGRIWPEDECDGAIVKIEHSFDDGRIDLLIQCDSRMLIIENKPYASDQDNQLYRYFKYAEEQNKDRLSTTIVYLTPTGQRPSTGSLGVDEVEARTADGTLVLQSYRDLALTPKPELPSWLDACRLACRSPRVAGFIQEIQTQINAEFSGVRDMNESEALVGLMSETSDTISSSFQIAQSLYTMKEVLFLKLVNQLTRVDGVELSASQIIPSGFALNFDVDKSSPYIVRIQAYDVLAIGLMRRDGKNSHDPQQIAVGSQFAARLASVSQSTKWGGDLWAWVVLPDLQTEFCPLPSNFWANPEPWIQLAAHDRGDRRPENDVASKLIAAVRKIKNALAGVQAETIRRGGR